MTAEDITLSEAEYAAILRGHAWIRSVDPYASLSRGWAEIAVEMLDALDAVMTEVAVGHPDAHVVDWTTKSKMGWLRVFFRLEGLRGSPATAWPLLRPPIDLAEGRSTLTCESCGAPGRLLDVDGWLSTLCDIHSAEVEGFER